MSKILIGVLSFVAGAAAGAVGSYFVTKKIMKKQSEIYIQQEIDTALADLKKPKEDIPEVEEKDEVEKACDEIREKRKVKNDVPDAERRKYREFADGYSPTPFDPEDPVVKEALAKSRVDSDNPFIITEDEYGCDNYDTVELYYHAEVPDITDDDGNLNDPDETVGSKLFNKFADDPDVDEIYVRNPFLMIDFHLQRELLK